MAKSKKSKKNAQPRVTGPPTAMVAQLPLTPEMMVRPVPRQRGNGPVCAECGSGMTVIRTDSERSRLHPLLRRATRLYGCLRRPQGCDYTTVRVSEER